MSPAMQGGSLLVLALILPVGGMLAAFVLGGRAAERIALATLGFGALLALLVAAAVYRAGAPLAYAVGGWAPPLGLALRADGLASALLLTSWPRERGMVVEHLLEELRRRRTQSRT